MVYPQKMSAEIAGVGVDRGQPYLYWVSDQEEVRMDFSKSRIQDLVYADVYARAFGFVSGNDMWRWLDCAENSNAIRRRVEVPPISRRGLTLHWDWILCGYKSTVGKIKVMVTAASKGWIWVMVLPTAREPLAQDGSKMSAEESLDRLVETLLDLDLFILNSKGKSIWSHLTETV